MKCSYCKFGSKKDFWIACLRKGGWFSTFIEPSCTLFESAPIILLDGETFVRRVEEELLKEVLGTQNVTYIVM